MSTGSQNVHYCLTVACKRMLIAWLRFQAVDTGGCSGWVVQKAGWFPDSQNTESGARTAVAEAHVCLGIVTRRSELGMCASREEELENMKL